MQGNSLPSARDNFPWLTRKTCYLSVLGRAVLPRNYGENSMRKILILSTSAAILMAAPALALGLGDLAKVVLGGKSVLKKAETKCGAAGSLSAQDNSTISLAVAAAKKALPEAQFLALNSAAENDATKQAETPAFCPETAKKKKGLIGKIGSAGKKLLKAKALGL
jgi:hypothetical protein